MERVTMTFGKDIQPSPSDTFHLYITSYTKYMDYICASQEMNLLNYEQSMNFLCLALQCLM